MELVLIISAVLLLQGYLLINALTLCRIAHKDKKSFPSCTIIIPARNEEKKIASLLKSIYNQSFQPVEVIVADDQSHDKTAHIAQSMGAYVLSVLDKPSQWTGKTWACWQAAQQAQGDLLCFLDADTVLEKQGLEKIVSTFIKKPGFVTIQPYHRMYKAYEHWSALFNILILIGSNAFSLLSPLIKGRGGFGPCMLCLKQDYFRCGGHRSVSSTVLENLSMAKNFMAKGLPVSCYAGMGAVSFRMYPDGFKNLIEGWVKGFATGAAIIPRITLLFSILWISGMFLISIVLCFVLFNRFNGSTLLLSLIMYSLYALHFYYALHKAGNFPKYTALLFPIHALFFVGVFTLSYYQIFIRKRVSWKDRTVEI